MHFLIYELRYTALISYVEGKSTVTNHIKHVSTSYLYFGEKWEGGIYRYLI